MDRELDYISKAKTQAQKRILELQKENEELLLRIANLKIALKHADSVLQNIQPQFILLARKHIKDVLEEESDEDIESVLKWN